MSPDAGRDSDITITFQSYVGSYCLPLQNCSPPEVLLNLKAKSQGVSIVSKHIGNQQKLLLIFHVLCRPDLQESQPAYADRDRHRTMSLGVHIAG